MSQLLSLFLSCFSPPFFFQFALFTSSSFCPSFSIIVPAEKKKTRRMWGKRMRVSLRREEDKPWSETASRLWWILLQSQTQNRKRHQTLSCFYILVHGHLTYSVLIGQSWHSECFSFWNFFNETLCLLSQATDFLHSCASLLSLCGLNQIVNNYVYK